LARVSTVVSLVVNASNLAERVLRTLITSSKVSGDLLATVLGPMLCGITGGRHSVGLSVCLCRHH
jgi:hypothetical protein